MFGNWGYPGFNFPPPPMNLPGNTPNYNIGDPRVYQGFGMRPPSFPIYPSTPVRNDHQFPGNPSLDRNGFWAGQYEALDTTKNVQPYINPEENRNRVLVELPKEVEKANPESQQVVSQPQSSGEPKKKRQKGKRRKEKRAANWRDGKLYAEEAELHKKLLGQMPPPPEKPEVVLNSKWRSDPSKMYSCDLCQYHTPDQNLMERHLYCSVHYLILLHLCDFFPRQKVEQVQRYLICKKNEMLMENKKYIVPFSDKIKGIGARHFFHRVQATHCQACDVLIPDVEKRVRKHVESAVHHQNCQATLSKIKHHSPVIAAEILEELNMEEEPFNDVRSPQVSGTNEVLVAEEDEEGNDVTYDEDTIDNARDDPEVPVTHNESPAHETKDSDKMFLPNEPEMNEPATSSMTLNPGGTVEEEETEEEEEEAAEAP